MGRAWPGHRARHPSGRSSRATLLAVSLFKAASTVSLLTLASRITGLVRELLMASVFGVSAMTDAFNVAFRIPNLFRRVLGEGAFSQAFVPVLAATRAQEGDDGARALIDQPELLLADEPTGNVDPPMAKRILKLFGELNRIGTAVVIATHDLGLMELYDAPRLVLADGHLHVDA
eukprot:gene27833-biopygen20472